MNDLNYEAIDDIFYLKKAYEIAKTSLDPSTQNGVIIATDCGSICGRGINCLPRGLKYTQEQYNDREWKYKNVVHAEVAAVCNAAYLGYGTSGCIAYCTWAACSNCAKTLVQAGIDRVVTHKHPMQIKHANWVDSVNQGHQIFKDCGVEFVEIEGHIGQTIRFNYELVDL